MVALLSTVWKFRLDFSYSELDLSFVLKYYIENICISTLSLDPMPVDR